MDSMYSPRRENRRGTGRRGIETSGNFSQEMDSSYSPRRGRGRGRGRGKGRCRGSRYSSQEAFNTSTDGSEFYFSTKIDADESIREEYKKNLRCIGGYSEDEDQNFCNDKSYLTFLNTVYLPTGASKEKEVSLDLNIGLEKGKPYSGTLLNSFHNYLSWILSNKEQTSAELFKTESKFVCMKNVLLKLFKIFHGFALELKFYAICIDGVIYILNHKMDENYPNFDKISLWGHKLEQYFTYGENVEEGVISNCDYRCVLTSNLGPHKLFISTSIDCVNPDLYDETFSDLSACVSFKCSHDSRKEGNKLRRFKMYDWCLSLALSGTPCILVAYRNFDGVVQQLKLYEEDDLVQEGKEFWNIDQSFTFTEKLLSFIKMRTEASPGTPICFVKPEYASQIFTSEGEMEEFPPAWFTKEFKEFTK